MVLAVDVGNTVTTIGLFAPDGAPVFFSTVQTNRDKTKDQCAIDLMNVFRLNGAEVSTVEGGILSCVVPPVAASMTDAMQRLTGRRPIIVGPGTKTGLNIRSDLHNQLGADIVACSVAATARYPSPVIVVDMSTAITFSFLREGVYEGCAICPGIRLGMEALSERAAELPHISLEKPPAVMGHNTIDAMRAGILYGNAGLVDSMIDRLQEGAGECAAAVVAVGDQAPLILSYCQHEILYDPDLLMHGLYLLYLKNNRKPKKDSI